MKVYVFGNQDDSKDKIALEIASKIEGENIEFIKINPNQDLPFINEKQVIILDTVEGIKDVTLISDKDLDKLILSKSLTVHDFDLGFQLKYLKKLGKIGEIIIIGIPMKKQINYFRIQSILRKLVAQDMHGS
jgi:Ni,Fe-hydrogenase maturation factor